MKRRALIAVLPVAGVGWGLPVEAGTRRALAIVTPGLSEDSLSETGIYGGFFSELRRLGYAEGQTFSVDRYSAHGRTDQLSDIARRVVRSKPDCIFAIGLRAARALKAATSDIPIVGYTVNPVIGGLVKSMARPGGNITGFSADAGAELSDKIIEVLLQAVPNVRRIAHLLPKYGWDTTTGPRSQSVQLLGAADGDLTEEADYRRFFDSLTLRRAQAVVVGATTENVQKSELIVSLARQANIPAIYPSSAFVRRGGLISYGPDESGILVGLAGYVARILGGAAPGELPFQEAWKFETAINLATAKDLRIVLPRALFARADIIVE